MTRLEKRIAAHAPAAHVCVDGAAVLSRSDLEARAAAIGAALQAATVPAEPVLATDDPFDFLAALLAAWRAGAAAMIPANMQSATLAQHVSQGRTVVDAAWLGRLDGSASPAPAAAAPSATVLLQTSGSSGEPKAVAKTLAQLAAEIDVLEACWGTAIGEATVLATVPHHHLYGLLFRVLWPFAAGRAFDRHICLDADQLQAAVQRRPQHVLVASPAHLARWPDLMDLARWSPRPRLVFSSGAPLDAATAAVYRTQFGAAPVEVYGSTETGGIASRRRATDADAHWTPLPAVRVGCDPDGALRVESPWSGGSCRLEDAVDVGADGLFHLGARMDRIAKLEGKRVSLAEVESVLARHPWVRAAAVEPLPASARLGALLQLTDAGRAAFARDGRAAIAHALRDHLLAVTERIAVPRRYRIADALPCNERGKIDRHAVLALLQADDATVA